MAVLDPIKPTILATRVIPNVDRSLAAKLELRPEQRSIALVTCDIDDSLYVSLDEATKAADVEVVYAHSFYAGSAHASGPLSGEIIGVLAAPDPAEARAGLAACIDYAENKAWFHAADATGDLAFFAHPIARIGSYLASEGGVPQGTSMAYLIAPPLEATFALDAVDAAIVGKRRLPPQVALAGHVLFQRAGANEDIEGLSRQEALAALVGSGVDEA